MMESAFAWIGWIMEWFGRFIPRRMILDTTEGAIKYRRGSEIIYCGPGVHWFFPWSTKWHEYPIARQTDRLQTQTIETKDGVTFIVSATLTYQVNDLLKLLPLVHSATLNTIDLGMTAVHDVCCDFTWAELQGEQRRGTIKTKLKNEAQKQLGEYGITVIKLQLNTLARCRVIKISQSTAAEEN